MATLQAGTTIGGAQLLSSGPATVNAPDFATPAPSITPNKYVGMRDGVFGFYTRDELAPVSPLIGSNQAFVLNGRTGSPYVATANIEKFPFAIAPGGVATSLGVVTPAPGANTDTYGIGSDIEGFVSGYSSPSATVTRKFPFAITNPGTFTNLGSLDSGQKLRATTHANPTHGFITIASTPVPTGANALHKFPFNIASGGGIGSAGTLVVSGGNPLRGAAGISLPTKGASYSANSFLNMFPWSISGGELTQYVPAIIPTPPAVPGPTQVNGDGARGFMNSSTIFLAGGNNSPPTIAYSGILTAPVANLVNFTYPLATLATGRISATASQTSTNAFLAGSPVVANTSGVNTIEKFPFAIAPGGVSVNIATLNAPRGEAAGCTD